MAFDGIVIGSGPNGLVAANILADHGWSVCVCEEQDEPGGAVRSGELTLPGHTHDLFSAFYPLSVASKPMQALELERWGLRWLRSAGAVAHPQPDGSCTLLHGDLDRTAAGLEAEAPGDGDAWRRLIDLWDRVGDHLVEGLLTPFPPVRAGVKIAAAMRADLPQFARAAVLPVRRMGEETFSGQGGRNLLAGNALHADFSPESTGSGLFALVLCGLAQRHGFPVPEGGAGQLTAALVRRLEAKGGVVRCGAPVREIVLAGGRASAVRLQDGERVDARRAVLADTDAPQLYEDLLPADAVPTRVRAGLRRFQWDNGALKVDWALKQPIPWTAEEARCAGTVHVADGVDALTMATAQLSCGQIPDTPFLVMGQYSMVDATRSPAGTDIAWAYTHVPPGLDWDEGRTAQVVERIEEEIERRAPGFRDLIAGRHVFTPPGLEAADRNLRFGAMNNGTAQVHQQLVFRPVPGLGRPETPVTGLYLASAAAHPGGGVHGGPGANAARTALAHDRLARLRAWRPRRATDPDPRPSPAAAAATRDFAPAPGSPSAG